MPTRISYIPLDNDLREQAPAIPIDLLPDGTADLSNLPSALQNQLTMFGVQNATHTGSLFPRDGEAFLEALLEWNDLYQRFREEPTIQGTV